MAGRIDRMLAAAAVLLVVVGAALALTAHENRLFDDSREYASVAEHIAGGDGVFTDTAEPGELTRPRYPPGLPLLLTPAAAGDVRVGSRLLSVAFLTAAVWAAWALAGPAAGLLAGAMVVTAPFFLQSAQTVLADAAGAACALAVLALMARPTAGRMVFAGVMSGVGLNVRAAYLPILIAAVVAAPRGLRRWVLLGAVPLLVGLGTYQWHAFGAPWRTGYTGETAQWAWSYLSATDAMTDRTLQLAPLLTEPFELGMGQPGWLYWIAAPGLWWVFAPPLVGYLGLCGLWVWRSQPAGRFAVLTVAGTIALLLPYFWHATRLIARRRWCWLCSQRPCW